MLNMDVNLLTIFVVLNIVNVIIQTIKSLCTVKCGKVVAALVNAVAYGLYTVVLVYTVCDLPLIIKVVVVSFANLVGVFVVKYLEERATKDKLWKVEVTLPKEQLASIIEDCQRCDLSYNYVDIKKYCLLNVYCPTHQDSEKVKKLLSNYDVHYFVTESKAL